MHSYQDRGSAMPRDAQPKSDQAKSEICNCLALRQATRHVTQFYDRFLASSGLRTTQFSILARLRLAGPLPINALAKRMVMDRTTLGRNILPLEREGLIEIVPDPADRRSKVVRLTEAGAARLREARAGWTQAQKKFEAAFGGPRAARLRDLLQAVTATELGAAAGAG
jgi:DNA-binding MarR family transcriptional regulator